MINSNIQNEVDSLIDGDIEKLISAISDDPVVVAAIKQLVYEVHTKNHASHIDKLTNLPNRGAAYELIAGRIAQFREELATSHGHVLFAFLDLDGFKPINDKFGHKAGDEALIEVSNRLKKSVRKQDLVIRWGGDEFIVLCKTDAKKHQSKVIPAYDFGKRLIKSLTFNFMGLKISASVGVVTIDALSKELDLVRIADIIEKSDEAMYRAKAKGKGMVEVDMEKLM